MKLVKFIFLGIFLVQSGLVSSQVKHEFKIPIFEVFDFKVHPTYELLTRNDKIGIEIGFGINSKRQRLLFQEEFDQFNYDWYKRRQVLSSLALKYYLQTVKKHGVVRYAFGPVINYSRTTFIEDRFLEKQVLVFEQDGRKVGQFVGQNYIGAGFLASISYVHSSKIIFSLQLKALVNIKEVSKDVFETNDYESIPQFHIGYRFGSIPSKKNID